MNTLTAPIKAKYTSGMLLPLSNMNLNEGDEVIIRFIRTANSGEDDISTDESRAWMEAELEEKLPPYEWGKEGVPNGKPVIYDPEMGFIVTE